MVGGAAAVGDPVVPGLFVKFVGGELGRQGDAVGGGDLFAFFGFFGGPVVVSVVVCPATTVVVWW